MSDEEDDDGEALMGAVELDTHAEPDSISIWYIGYEGTAPDEKRRIFALSAAISVGASIEQLVPTSRAIELFLLGAADYMGLPGCTTPALPHKHARTH